MVYRHKTIVLAVLLQLCSNLLSAQYENVWTFGDNVGVDFNSGKPVAIRTNVSGFGEGNASVCDKNGQLLFYTEGTYVWDKNYQLMPNGKELTPILSATGYSATSSTTQGTIIVPAPGSPSRYYIFSLTSVEQESNAGKLYYSVVDLSLNGGKGDVVMGQKGIFVDSGLLEKMTTVVGDQCNIWLVACSGEPKFRSYEITASGVNANPVVSAVGFGIPFLDAFGCIAISPDRKKLAAAKCYGSGPGVNGLAVFDFDARTGIVANTLQLLPTMGAYGVAFSPDGSKLYATVNFDSIFQFDLSSGNIATIRESRSGMGRVGLSKLKLAPDGKIYFATRDKNSLGVIASPNASGTAAQFIPNYLPLLDSTNINKGGFPEVISFLETGDTLYHKYALNAACWSNNLQLPLTQPLGWNYFWNDGDTSRAKIVTSSGIYSVRYFASPCVLITDSFVVNINSGGIPEIDLLPACAESKNGKVWIKQGNDFSAYHFSWKDALGKEISVADSLLDIPAGTYTLQVKNGLCDTVFSILIPKEDFKVSFIMDTLVCVDGAVSFRNTSPDYFGSYKWSFGDQSFSEKKQPNHIYQQAGSYGVQLIGKGTSCIDTTYGNLQVDAPTTQLYFDGDRREICVGESIQFTPHIADQTITELEWDFGQSNSIKAPIQKIQHAFDNDGEFQVRLTARFRACPQQEVKDLIVVHPFPVVDLGTDTLFCFEGGAAHLYNHAATQTGSSYLWNTGARTPSIAIQEPGYYSLSLTSDHGCVLTENINIKKGCYLDIPNAFTPDGDGNNDHFFPRQISSKNMISFHMQVFNRWGQLIFETRQLNGAGWDGRFNREQQPSGVYIYQIEVVLTNGSKEQYKGNVTLLR